MLKTWRISAALSSAILCLLLSACSQSHRVTEIKDCPQKPPISPVLLATPKVNYEERLKALWLLQENATKK